MSAPFQVSQTVLGAAASVSDKALATARRVLAGTLNLTAGVVDGVTAVPLVDKTPFAEKLHTAAQAVVRADDRSAQALQNAASAVQNAFAVAQHSLHAADAVVERALYENIAVSSLVGESFVGVPASKIKPSFRLAGRDADASQVSLAFVASGLSRVALCIPGHFADETMWHHPAASISQLLHDLGIYAVCVRVNPGAHISHNGGAVLALMQELLATPALAGHRIDVLTYSQGGLILRSALLQALERGIDLPARIRRAVLVSSPDGGSAWEKIGYWLGVGLEHVPIAPVRWVGFLGNQRADAIKDLSHGIIRERDWQRSEQLLRYGAPRTFGELDAVDAYQIYSLVSDREDSLAAWLGDGMVERQSLTLLSDTVYRNKPSPQRRVTCIVGQSHFSIMQSEALLASIRDILIAP